jgi:hypothetical protein
MHHFVLPLCLQKVWFIHIFRMTTQGIHAWLQDEVSQLKADLQRHTDASAADATDQTKKHFSGSYAEEGTSSGEGTA